MSFIFDTLFSSIAFGHLIVDTLSSQRFIILTYWSNEYGMSNTTLALVTTIYIWGTSLTQPFFGWLADRFGKIQTLAAGGILWITGMFALALFLPLKWAIPCLLLASLGSAAFHPVGTMQAALRGNNLLPNRETTVTSWFFLFGQFGYFIGPIIGGLLLQSSGLSGLFILTVPALLIGVNAAWQLHRFGSIPRTAGNTDANTNLRNESNHSEKSPPKIAKTFIVALVIVAALQSWSQNNISTFIPKYLSDIGQPPSIYGFVAGIFMGGAAVGNVLGAYLADHYGKRRVASVTLALSCIPLFLISFVSNLYWLYVLVLLAGALTGAVYSIIVVLAFKTIRGGMALASGLILGFMFSSGALGTLFSGILADSYGMLIVFQSTAGLTFVAALVAYFGLYDL